MTGETTGETVPVVTFLTREACCLCDEAMAVVEAVRADVPFELEIVDVDRDPALRQQYTDEVPVLLINGHKAFKYRVDAGELRRRLGDRGFWSTVRRWFGR